MQGLLTDLGKQGGIEALASRFGAEGAIMSGAEVRAMDATGDTEAVKRRAAQIVDARASQALTSSIQKSSIANDIAQGMRGGFMQAAARGYTRVAGAVAGAAAGDARPITDKIDKTNTILQKIADKPTGATF
jgi:hypothetical protein